MERQERGHGICGVRRAKIFESRNVQEKRRRSEDAGVVRAGAAAKLASSDAKLYVYTIGVSGKVKRIRNNPQVRIAPCDMRGGLKGEWVDARAEIVTGAEAERGMRLLNQKYVPWKQLLDFFASFRKRERTVFAVRPA